ncbi:MAG: tetratricopeptide repeat protein [bacterium]
MKALLKFLVAAGVITAAIVILTNANRKRATAPAGPPAHWEPPSVVPTPPAPAEEEVAAAEAEGMTPPPQETAVDIARGSDGQAIVSELAATGVAEPSAPEATEPDPVAVAEEEGMTPPPDAPPEDVALNSSGEPLISELAAIPLADLTAEALREPEMVELAAAEHEGMTAAPDELDEDLPRSADGSPVISELGSPAAEATLHAETALAAHEDAVNRAEDEGMTPPPSATAVDIARSADATLAAAEAQGAAAFESEAAEATAAETDSESADFLTKYFEELAATPEEPDAPLAVAEPEVTNAAATVSARGGDEGFLASVEEALDDLEPAPIVPPPRRSAESYLDEGNVYFNVGQYSLAVERYGQAIGLDSNLTAAFYNRANAHTRAGEFEKALADYDRALELQPRDADALNNRGMLHLYRANYTAALKDFNGALEADPSDTTVMVNRGLAHLHGGNAADALVDFREATTMDSSDAAAQYGAAQASASLGNRDEALKHVTRALELDPGYAREAAADPRLALLQGDEEFLALLRQSGSRSGR